MPRKLKPQADDSPLIDIRQAAVRLGTSRGVLYGWRHKGVGPVSFKLGRKVVYRESAIENYLDAQEQNTGRGGELA